MNIKILFNPDNWVMGYFGREMTKAVAKYNKPDGYNINIYMPYALFKEKDSNALDIAYFTHNSFDGVFESVAKGVDVCICMSPIYERYLKVIGIKNVHTLIIPPDEYYDCKLNLAWVGHFFWKERKGIDLFNKVRDLPFVNLIYNQHATDLDVPVEDVTRIKTYYDRCDFVLVTSKFEGGPMCLVEGLKCGKKVICPMDVGVAEVFKDGIIVYKNSDWESLKYILTNLYENKKRVADLVKDLTWDNWFEKLITIINFYA